MNFCEGASKGHTTPIIKLFDVPRKNGCASVTASIVCKIMSRQNSERIRRNLLDVNSVPCQRIESGGGRNKASMRCRRRRRYLWIAVASAAAFELPGLSLGYTTTVQISPLHHNQRQRRRWSGGPSSRHPLRRIIRNNDVLLSRRRPSWIKEHSRLFVGVAASPSSVSQREEDDDSEGYSHNDERSVATEEILQLHDLREEMQIRTDKLLSYAYSLQRARKQQHGNNTDKKGNKSPTAVAKSFVAYLTHNPYILPLGNASEDETMVELVNACERAVIQAVRVAGEVGDYKLIMSIIDSSILYANNHAILTPRIFGEAIQTLANQTSSNISKFKHIWNVLISTASTSDATTTCLHSPITAFELNVMIQALASRGKVGACMELYREYTASSTSEQQSPEMKHPLITPDAYTASTLFTILTDSIRPDQSEDQQQLDEDDSKHATASSKTRNLQATLTEISPSSTCWQWDTALELLSSLSGNANFEWNNHVFGALLKLHGRVQEVYEQHRSVSSQVAVAVIESMMRDYNVIPDVVTLTLAMKAMGDGEPSADYREKDSWKMAVRLLEQMKHDSNLPNPNVFTYSTAIMACARCNAYQEAVKLLEEMTTNLQSDETTSQDDASVGEWHPPNPNTWVYNAVLFAISGSHDDEVKESALYTSTPYPSSKQRRKQRKLSEEEGYQRRSLALNLLSQMTDLHQQYGMDTAPDTVTYNTVLGIVASNPPKKDSTITASVDSNNIAGSEDLVQHLLRQTKEKGIGRDAITYHNAILASRGDGRKVVAIMDAALDDVKSINDSLKSKHRPTTTSSNQVSLEDKAGGGITFVFNSALSVLSKDRRNFEVVFSSMQKAKATMNAETTTYVIEALAHGIQIPALSSSYYAMGIEGEEESGRSPLVDLLDQRLSGVSLPVQQSHYSEAISACLLVNKIEEAHSILSLMKEKGLNPTKDCLQKFCLAYSRLAIKTASKERALSKLHDEEQEECDEDDGVKLVDSTMGVSQKRARNAYSIAMALQDPSPHVLCTVGKACAITSLWEEARTMLQSAHKYYLGLSATSTPRSAIALLSGTHEMLLRQAAVEGDLQAALWYADDIQRFSRKMRTIHDDPIDPPTSTTKPRKLDSELETEALLSTLRDMSTTRIGARPVNVGMKAECWRHVLTAASKDGNWQVCLNTLQNLRPSLEKIRPTKENAHKVEIYNKRYERLAPALITVARCLEQHNQYAWAVRAIDDWMEWSGRRPRVEAASAVFRALSSRGRGEEVNSLLLRCANQEDKSNHDSYNGVGYEELLFVRAVTALHYNGLYDDADDAYLAGMTQGHLFLPLDDHEKEWKGKVVLDLHGMNVALAHSAVRIAMRQAAVTESGKSPPSSPDMIIVTGRGRNSALQLRPVLRPEVQRMMLEEFYPPLNTFSVPNNMGALVVPSDDIAAWQAHQREQKGARMLAVAALLKHNLSSVNLIRQRIAAAAAKRAAGPAASAASNAPPLEEEKNNTNDSSTTTKKEDETSTAEDDVQ